MAGGGESVPDGTAEGAAMACLPLPIRAHLSLLQAVAAGILPAVEGGILAARNERGSGRAT